MKAFLILIPEMLADRSDKQKFRLSASDLSAVILGISIRSTKGKIIIAALQDRKLLQDCINFLDLL